MTDEKLALVTGSSRGIGRAVNTSLAQAGYRCVIHYRRDEAGAREAVRELAAVGPEPLLIQADLGAPDAIDAMFDTVRREFGALDVVVANAASTSLRPLLEFERRHAERTYRETVVNLLQLLQRAAELLRDNGRVVYVSGMPARLAYPGYGLLGPAKAAGEETMRYLAAELGSRGITANSVVPGLVETVSARRSIGAAYDAMVAGVASTTPLHRAGTPEDVAGLVAFLVSDHASYITGQSIVIDGGASIVPGTWTATANSLEP